MRVVSIKCVLAHCSFLKYANTEKTTVIYCETLAACGHERSVKKKRVLVLRQLLSLFQAAVIQYHKYRS